MDYEKELKELLDGYEVHFNRDWVLKYILKIDPLEEKIMKRQEKLKRLNGKENNDTNGSSL